MGLVCALALTTTSFATYTFTDVVADLGSKYADVGSFSEGYATVTTAEGYCGIIDVNGNEILAPSDLYDSIGEFNDGLATFVSIIFTEDNYQASQGYLNTSGEQVMVYEGEPSADSNVSSFSNGYAVVRYMVDGVSETGGYMSTAYCLVIDTTGTTVLSLTELGYNTMQVLGGSVGSVSEDGLLWVYSVSNDAVDYLGKVGIINLQGEVVAPFIYDDVSSSGYQDGLIAMKKDGKWGYLDSEGNEVIPFTADLFWNFSEGLCATYVGDKIGYMDATGTLVIPAQFDGAWSFSEGMAKVYLDGQIGFIDTTGAVVIPFETLPASSSMEDGHYLFGYGEFVSEWGVSSYVGTLGLRDATGATILPDVFDDLDIIAGEGTVIATQDGNTVIAKIPTSPYVSNPTAAPTTSAVLVDGADTAFEAYNISDNNYFKLRDIAQILSGTDAQFSVEWDGDVQAINLVTGEAYISVGGELAAGDGTAKEYITNSSTIYINGVEVSLTAYTINDNNYFKLRDLGEALGFNVSWDSNAGSIVIASDEAYTAD